MIAALYAICFNVISLPLLDVADIIVLTLFMTRITTLRIHFYVFAIFVMIFTIFSLNNFYSSLTISSLNMEHIAFYYKWALPFIILSLLTTFYKSDASLQLLQKHLYYFTFLLVGWVFLYTPMLFSGLIQGSFRPSYPFSEDFQVSDAHVLSACLGILFVTFYFLDNVRYKFIFLLLLLIALLLTGSRSGSFFVLMLAIFEGARGGFLILKRCYVKKSVLMRFFLLATLFFMLMNFSLIPVETISVERVITRALDINFVDESANGRVNKLQVAMLQMANSNMFFGPGFLAADLRWYDGALATVMIHGGVFLVFILTLIISFLVITFYKSYPMLVLILTLVLSNLITEHFLITRYLIPVMYCFWLLIHQENKKIRNTSI